MIPHNRPTLEEVDVKAISRVVRSGHIAQGIEVAAFEEEIAERFGGGQREAVAVSSGTAALYLSLKALGVAVGDRVLIPTYVCTALLHAVSLAGAEVLLADVRDTDFNLDPPSVPSSPNLKAVILPHTYGVPSDPKAFERFGAPIIEDGAQAIGSIQNGCLVGRNGDLSVFSFYATKPLTCGQGGMVLGPKDLCQDIRDRRDYDGKPALRQRFNFQMTDIQAALGRSQLRRFQGFLDRRREAADLYAAALPAALGRQQALPGAEPNHFRFVIRLRQVAEARSRFEASRISAIVPTEPWELLHRQLGLPPSDFPKAEAVARTTLSLPIQPSLTNAERECVAAVLRSLGDLQ